MCVYAVHFQACEVGSQLGIFYSNNARYDYFNALSFGVNYNCEAQKLRILAIEAIFDPKNQFLTASIDDRIIIKAEITSFIMRYCINSIKLRLQLRVATIKKVSCAWLQVGRGFGMRSCWCSNSK